MNLLPFFSHHVRPPRQKRAAWLRQAFIIGALLAVVLLALPAAGCSPAPTSPPGAPQISPPGAPAGEAPEIEPLAIPLTGPLSEAKAEISGLAWYSDTLIILPQYPQRMSNQTAGAVFGLRRAEIEAFIAGRRNGPLTPFEIPLESGGVERLATRFEGYEAIAFYEQQAFLAIEARQGGEMTGYLVRGEIAPDLSRLTLDPATLTANPLQAQFDNQSDEALLIDGQMLLALYEVNGQTLNPQPHASQFDLNLQPQPDLPFPHLEYRLTDATAPDAQGRFWVMNYFYPGDSELKPTVDPLTEKYGPGATHRKSQVVERLVELQITPQGIQLVDRAPILLQLSAEGEARNWEGLVRLPGLGFIIATDKFPSTILAFVRAED